MIKMISIQVGMLPIPQETCPHSLGFAWERLQTVLPCVRDPSQAEPYRPFQQQGPRIILEQVRLNRILC